MRILVDTNILVRSVQTKHPSMRVARRALRALIQRGDELYVTPQNIAEFWNVCTRPVEFNGLGMSIGVTDRLTSRIETFFLVLTDSMEAFRQWRRLIVTHEVRGAKVHDARLVAIMQTNALKHLLTFDADDFKRYTNIAVIHPGSL